jgi:hypothetical protein
MCECYFHCVLTQGGSTLLGSGLARNHYNYLISFSGTNALAYLASTSVTKRKKFYNNDTQPGTGTSLQLQNRFGVYLLVGGLDKGQIENELN